MFMLYNSFRASYYFRLLHPGVLLQCPAAAAAGRAYIETIKKIKKYNKFLLLRITKLNMKGHCRCRAY